MRMHSQYFELALAGFVAAFVYLFQPVFEHLFAETLMAWLETYMKISEAEVIARLSEIVLPIVGMILLIWALYRFLKREVIRKFGNEDARLDLANLRTEGVGLRNRALTTGPLEWIGDSQSWTEKVIQTIKKISPADAEWFRTLDAVPPSRILLDTSNVALIHAHRMHDFYLVKLERLVDKYE